MDFVIKHWPGFVIIALTLLLVPPFLLIRWKEWKRRAPEQFYRGVGIRYMPGATKPWDGMEQAIDAILDQLPHEEKLRNRLADFSNFWIEVHPWSGTLVGIFMKTGFVDENNRAVMPPAVWDGKIARATGTIDGDRAFFFTPHHNIIMTRQKPRGATQEENFYGKSNGNPPVSAGESSIHHEYAEHLVSARLNRGWNSGHTDEELKQLKNRIRDRYNALRKGTA